MLNLLKNFKLLLLLHYLLGILGYGCIYVCAWIKSDMSQNKQ